MGFPIISLPFLYHSHSQLSHFPSPKIGKWLYGPAVQSPFYPFRTLKGIVTCAI